MKITIESDNIKCTIDEDTTSTDKVLDMCIRAMIGVTHHSISVENAILNKAESIKEEIK